MKKGMGVSNERINEDWVYTWKQPLQPIPHTDSDTKNQIENMT